MGEMRPGAVGEARFAVFAPSGRVNISCRNRSVESAIGKVRVR
ncbi:hypothetical protein HMPREF1155_0242 [Slackia sp. CM382]|nr:hypothetical protein HMPREF1155_0242 [Slackia sp. CM382]